MDINFQAATNTIAEVLPIMRPVQLIDKYKFTNIALDENSEIFVVHIAAIKVFGITIHLFWAEQMLSNIQLTALQ